MSRFIRVPVLVWLIGVAIAVVLTVAYIDAAAAQTVDMRPAVSQVFDYALTALATVLTVLGGFAIRFVSSRIGLANSQLEADLASRLNDIIHRAIDYAKTTAQNEVNKPGSGISKVVVDNWFLSMAASYVNRSAPEIIKKFALSQQRIEEMIIARLPGYEVPIQGGLPAPETTRPEAA